MSKCPKCGAAVSDEFGLIECGQCGAQLLVHIDGRVESAAQLAQATADSEVAPYIEMDPEPVPTPEVQIESDSFDEPMDLTAQAMDSEVPPPEPIFATEYQEPGEPENPDLAITPEEQIEASLSNTFAGVADEPVPVAPITPREPQNSPDLSDIGKFGNSAQSGSFEGGLRYTILVSGIDTADVRESFREAITDRKMMWDTEEILRSIREGRVEIQNISPIRAHLLVTRLRELPVSISWEQYAVAQT